MSMKTQALRAEGSTRMTSPRYIVGTKKGERGKALRYIVGRALDSQLLHTTSQGIRVQIEEHRRPFRSFDHPSGLCQHRQDMVLFDRFERQSLTESLPRPRAHRDTSAPIVPVRGARSISRTCRDHGAGVCNELRQDGAVQPEDWALRQKHGTLEKVLQLANIAR